MAGRHVARVVVVGADDVLGGIDGEFIDVHHRHAFFQLGDQLAQGLVLGHDHDAVEKLGGKFLEGIQGEQHTDITAGKRVGQMSGKRRGIAAKAIRVGRLTQDHDLPVAHGGLGLEVQLRRGAQHTFPGLGLDAIAVVQNAADRAGRNIGEPGEIVDRRFFARHKWQSDGFGAGFGSSRTFLFGNFFHKGWR